MKGILLIIICMNWQAAFCQTNSTFIPVQFLGNGSEYLITEADSIKLISRNQQYIFIQPVANKDSLFVFSNLVSGTYDLFFYSKEYDTVLTKITTTSDKEYKYIFRLRQYKNIALRDTFFIPINPEFPGGSDSLLCFLEANLDKGILNSQNLTGKVIVVFDVDTNGMLINIRINPTMSPGLILNNSIIETEILRVLSLMPAWTPGQEGFKPIVMEMSLLIRFPYNGFICP